MTVLLWNNVLYFYRKTKESQRLLCLFFFRTDVGSQENLVACRLHSVKEIEKEIGADSLAYLSINAVHRLTGENCSFCDGCFTGSYPIPIPEDQGKSKFEQLIAEEESDEEEMR